MNTWEWLGLFFALGGVAALMFLEQRRHHRDEMKEWQARWSESWSESNRDIARRAAAVVESERIRADHWRALCLKYIATSGNQIDSDNAKELLGYLANAKSRGEAN